MVVLDFSIAYDPSECETLICVILYSNVNVPIKSSGVNLQHVEEEGGDWNVEKNGRF